jgi:hypothetical protein
VGEADLLELARVARSTWQNWVRAGLLQAADDGLYGEAAVVELLIVSTLLGALDLRQLKTAWRGAGTTLVKQALALPLDQDPYLLACVDLYTWQVRAATTTEALESAVRAPVPFPRGTVVFDLGSSIAEVRRTYWSRAAPAAELLKDRRRKRRSAVPTPRRRGQRS